MTNTPPFARNVNTVFQDYALFPHMTVAENVAYGLRVRGVAAAERAQQAAAMLDLVRLGEFGARRPHQLSGGQRQRVALARALINRPKVLLLDEPLGALDLKLREEMQVELKGLQQRLGITFVFVTHDQGEALSMADRVAVFSQGRIEQLDTPRELYNRPQTAFVASFVGSANVVGAKPRNLTGRDHGFAIRPELVDLLAPGEPATYGHVQCSGEVLDALYHGASSRLRVKVDEHTTQAEARGETAGGGVEDLTTGAACGLRGGRVTPSRSGLTMPGRAEFSLQGRRAFYFALLLPRRCSGSGSSISDRCSRCCCRASTRSTSSRRASCPSSRSRRTGSCSPTRAHRHPLAHAADGDRRHPGFRCHRLSGRAVHGALAGPRTKALLRGRDAADVDQLPRQVYAWRLILAKQGIASWGFEHLGLMGALDQALAVPVSADRHSPRRTSACSSSSSTCGCRS